ncbi:MAG: SOS response-associated peptidase [candidate division Zixibacteria bacterium]|nr:SOS response-associated peptidase [candidate division Zixibacteria bacterium]
MCGRYTITVKEEILIQRFKVKEYQGEYFPRFNVAPGQNNPAVLTNEKNNRAMLPMRWGLIPSWAKEEAIGNKMINARIETVTEKPSFRTAFSKRRCLVPADGYYEWEKNGKPGKKQPFRIILKSRELLAFAGLWDLWKNPEGETIHSYTIITTEADELVRKIHPRMPVILRPENEDVWLDPNLHDPNTLMKVLHPYPADLTEMYEISSLVGNPSIDIENCILPAN